MNKDIDTIQSEAAEAINRAKTSEEVEAIRVRYLGRKEGLLNNVLKSLKDLPLEEKRRIGPLAQQARKEIEEAIDFKLKSLVEFEIPEEDITLPGKRSETGHLHPLTKTENEILRIFTSLNFSVIDGPELESEYYNFDVLNIPADHPAREMWDTFWIKQDKKPKNSKDHYLLRTHTSPMQVRYMETHEPPFQIIVPGRTFRYEALDASHEANFSQVEGLMVGKDVSFANFKFVIEQFLKSFFKGKKIEFRFRSSYFPFVEPGVEVDIKFKNSKWLEVMGAGMVHPRVFEFAGYNPRDWQGFAFGCGIERLAMIKYNIPDIRMFYNGDLRFIKQF
ncbi:MAG TPA: phenylalanine--tRNA ligase subunit alpha [Candidatus Colwellbacteria bacterium]|nr:phenylalanine--tRNA ligase subunit alpha [Candidatus Colwellbacteria bacterium]